MLKRIKEIFNRDMIEQHNAYEEWLEEQARFAKTIEEHYERKESEDPPKEV